MTGESDYLLRLAAPDSAAHQAVSPGHLQEH
jgi:hypothetical protein